MSSRTSLNKVLPETPVGKKRSTLVSMSSVADTIQSSPYKYKAVWERAVKKIATGTMLQPVNHDSPLHRIGSQQSLLYRQTVTSESLQKLRNSFCVISPKNRLKGFWDVYIGLILLYVAVFTPFMLAFLSPIHWDAWFIIDLVIDVSFTVDVMLSLNTAFYDKQKVLVTSRRGIFLNYLRGWLVLDVLACIPVGLIEYFVSPEGDSYDYNSVLRALRMRSLSRLFKFSKLSKLFKHYNSQETGENLQEYLGVSYGVMRVFKLGFGLLFALHIVTCVWWLLAKLQGFHSSTWVVFYGLEELEVFSQYVAALYWAVTTVTTVGYGDISPQTTSERLFAILWMLAGIYVVSLTISSLGSIYLERDQQKIFLEKRMKTLEVYAKDKALPSRIIRRIQHHVTRSAMHESHQFSEELKLLRSLPSQLRYEIAKSMNHSALFKFAFFKAGDRRFHSIIGPMLKQRSYFMDEHVYAKGDTANNVYFLISGTVDLVNGSDDLIFYSVEKYGIFGHSEVIQKKQRSHTAVAGLTCSCFVMKQLVLQTLKEQFPKKYRDLQEAAESHREALQLELLTRKLMKAEIDREGVPSVNMNDMRRQAWVQIEATRLRDLAQQQASHPSNNNLELAHLTRLIEAIHRSIQVPREQSERLQEA